MQTLDVETLKRKVLAEIKRDTNGAVQGTMLKLSGSEPYFSYGVSLPKIKKSVELYAPNHQLAMALYATSIRELKLAALYIESPDMVTTHQLELWSSGFDSMELADNASMLFHKSPLSVEAALGWIGCDNESLPYIQRAGFLTLGKRARFLFDRKELDSYRKAYHIALQGWKTVSPTTQKSIEVFLVALAINCEPIRKELLSFDLGELGEEIYWQIDMQ